MSAPLGASSSSTDTYLVKQNTRIPRFLKHDLLCLNHVRRFRRKLSRETRSLIDACISNHPLNDFSIVVWLTFVAAVPFLGYRLLFTFFANLLVALLLSSIVRSKSPSSFDRRLKSRLRNSKGITFPCVEIWMAAVTFIFIAVSRPSLVAVAGLALLFAALYATRLFTLAWFNLQLLASAVLGVAGWAACEMISHGLFKRKIDRDMQLVFSVVVVTCFFGYVAYLSESNATPLMALPKSECEYFYHSARYVDRNGFILQMLA